MFSASLSRLWRIKENETGIGVVML